MCRIQKLQVCARARARVFRAWIMTLFLGVLYRVATGLLLSFHGFGLFFLMSTFFSCFRYQ